MEAEPLAGGLVMRWARPADADGIAAVLSDGGEPADAIDARLVLEDREIGDAVAVVVDGPRVVATLTLLDETLEVGEVAVSAGQIAMVASARDHERRGLVRALMDRAHREAAARGHLLTVTTGGPGFSRRFGYAHGVRRPTRIRLREGWRPGPSSATITVRAATTADITALVHLQRRAQGTADVRLAHPRHRWRWLLDRTGTVQVIAELDRCIVGSARSTPPEDDIVTMGELMASTGAAAEALLGFALAAADGVSAVDVSLPTGPVARAWVLGAGAPGPDSHDWYSVRIPEPAALLEHLRPVFERRLAASPLGRTGAAGEALISLDGSSVRFGYRDGVVGPMMGGGVVQAPVSAGGWRLPPDALARALLADGALAVEASEPNCRLGAQRELMATLFPPVVSDLALLCLG